MLQKYSWKRGCSFALTRKSNSINAIKKKKKKKNSVISKRINSTWAALEEVLRMFWTDERTPFMLYSLTCNRGAVSLLLRRLFDL